MSCSHRPVGAALCAGLFSILLVRDLYSAEVADAARPALTPSRDSSLIARAPTVLTLTQAERLALERHPLLAQSREQIEASRARAVYSGQLPDPQLKLGVENLPVNSFTLNRDGMTQVMVGVSQMFPPPGKLALTQRGAEQETAAAQARRRDLEARIQREVRRAWLDLYYQDRALDVVRLNLALADQMVSVIRVRYRTGQGEQADLLKAQLQRGDLVDQQEALLAARRVAQSRLARLLDVSAERLVVPAEPPPLPSVPSEQRLLQNLSRHPQVQALQSEIRARRYELAAARRDYYPEFGVEAAYGYRAAREANGDKLPDMISFGVVMSLPLFTAERQDRRARERRAQWLAARYQRDDLLLELHQEIEARYAELRRLKARLELLQRELLPQSEQTVAATLAAYRAGRMSIAEVLRARRESLDYALRRWRLTTDAALAVADLDYLAAAMTESSHER
ncbi:MAG: TolC family protein [Gammaproteobacteria bacterium]|nr:TolC family protein [Gammaproteobacteria bacterium]